MKKTSRKILSLVLLLTLVLSCCSVVSALTEDTTAKQTDSSKYMKFLTRSGSYLDFDFTQGFHYHNYVRLDVHGVDANGKDIETTYNEVGYRTYVKVGSNEEQVEMSKLGGVFTVDGVDVIVRADLVNDGKTVKVTYKLENKNNKTTAVSIGSGADTDITGNETGDNCINTMTQDHQQLRIEYGDYCYTVTADAGTPFTGAWIGHYEDYEDQIFTTGTVYEFGDGTTSRRGGSKDGAITWHWDMNLAANQVVEKVCYFQLSNLLEVTNVQCIADAENGKINLIVDYTDGKGRTQTLYYTPQGGSQGTATSNTNTSNNGQFNVMADAPAGWKAGNTYDITLYVKDNVGTESDTYTFKVTWPDKNPNGDMYITLAFKNTSKPFASVRDVPGAKIILPTDSKAGTGFLGWNTKEDATGTWYDGGAEYTIKHTERVLYAQWGAIQNYSVTLQKDGSAYTGRTVVLKNAKKTVTLTGNNGVYTASNIPAYTYNVYVDGVDTGIQVSNASPSTTVKYWTVSFNMGGHGSSIASQVVLNGKSATKPSDPVDTNWQFKGWFSNNGLTQSYNFGAVTNTTVVYAKWGQPSITDATIANIPDQTYNGKQLTPTLSLTLNGKALTLGTDYTVTWQNNVNAGTATAVIAGKGKLGGTTTKTFNILPRELTLTWGNNSFTYDGQSHVPTVALGNIVNNDNVTVSVSGAQINAGSYTATAGNPSNGNYKLPTTGTQKAFTIAKAKYNMSGVKFNSASYEYDGAAHSIAITGSLPAGVSVSYTNNSRTEVGVSSAVAKFTSTNQNYENPSSLSATLTITAKDISKAVIELGPQLYYNGKTQPQTIKSVKLNGKEITYKILKNTGLNADKYPLVIEGTGNYKGTLETTFTILPVKPDMSGVKFNSATYEYDGKAKSITITGTLPSGISVTYENNTRTEMGTSNAVAKFTSSNANYLAPDSLSASLTITAKDISKANIVLGPQLYYNGKTQPQTIKSVTLDGKEITYKIIKNTGLNADKYPLIIEGTGNYKGQLQTTFTILPVKPDMSGVKFNDASFNYDGQPHKIVITGTLPTGIVVSYEKNERTNAGTSTATAHFVSSNPNYLNPSDMTAKLEIVAKDISKAVIELGPQLIYNGLEQQQTIKKVTLDGKEITYKIIKNRGINAGEYPLVIEGTGDYKGTVEVKFTILPAKADMSKVLFEDKTFVEGPTRYLAVQNLPLGITVKYENNGKTLAGTYEVTAKFDGAGNFEPIDDMKATLHILRKTIDNKNEEDKFNTEPIISITNENGFDDDVIFVVNKKDGAIIPNDFKFEKDEDLLAAYELHLFRVAEDGTRTELTMEDVKATEFTLNVELPTHVESKDVTRAVQFNNPATEYTPGETLNVEQNHAVAMTITSLNDIALMYVYVPCTVHYYQLILFAAFVIFVILCRKHKLDALTIIGSVVLAVGTFIIYKQGYCDLCVLFTVPNIIALVTGLLVFRSNGKKEKVEEVPEELEAEAPVEAEAPAEEAPKAEEPAPEADKE